MPQNLLTAPAAPPPPHQTHPAPPAAALEARRWEGLLARYCSPSTARSLFELTITAVPYAMLWTGLVLCLNNGIWWGLVLTPLAAGFVMRMFMIQHDCGHGSFFRQKWANDLLGRIIGVFTLTPYDYWRRTHAIHHATTGNLDKRGYGDVSLMTVAEYAAATKGERRMYRLVRHPVVLLGIAPLYLFVFKYRLPFGLMRHGKTPWVSALATNLAIAAFVVGVGSAVGFGTFLAVQLPITLISGAIGVWLFFVQHQFEHTYWEKDKRWSFHAGALLGSTHLDLPAPLRWITANIGVHHVHHLASRIPSYRLRETLKDHPELIPMGRLTLGQSMGCFRYALWDESRQRLVPFNEVKALAA